MSLTLISADGAPPAVGPYSHAVRHGDMVYVSGCLALDENAKFIGGDAAQQAQKALSNLDKVLLASGATRATIVKTVVFLTDMADFAAVNEVYSSYFGAHKPARSCVAVSQLPLGASFEIEAVAAIEG